MGLGELSLYLEGESVPVWGGLREPSENAPEPSGPQVGIVTGFQKTRVYLKGKTFSPLRLLGNGGASVK